MASKSLRRKLVLFVVDGVLIAGSFAVAALTVARPGYFQEIVFGQPWFAVLPVLIALVAVYLVQGYHLEEIVTPWRGLSAMVIAAVSAAVVIGFAYVVLPTAPEFSAKVIALGAGLQAVLLWLARLVYGRMLTASSLKEHILIIGADESAHELARIIGSRQRAPYRVVAFLVSTGVSELMQPTTITLEQLPALLRSTRVDTVVLGMRRTPDARLVRAVSELKQAGVKVRELSDLYEELTGMLPVQHVGELTMLFQNFGQRNELSRVLERVINGGLALGALLVSLPVWPIIVVAQQLNSTGSIFVEHSDRIGLAGRPFRFYKFRSMVPNATTKGSALVTGTRDPRVTTVGRVLRKTHLDELPQLINILKGDMNFIGPRAEYVENVRRLEQEIPFYHERHLIKPGMTGWAQVRNVYTSASAEDTLEKIQYDLYYLKHRGLALDLAIILRTAKLIIQGRGIA